MQATKHGAMLTAACWSVLVSATGALGAPTKSDQAKAVVLSSRSRPAPGAAFLPPKALNASIVNGICTTDLKSAEASEDDLDAYAKLCAGGFVPPSATVSTPGLLFIGVAIGRTTELLIAPAVGIGGGAEIPLVLPVPEWEIAPDGSNVQFKLPRRLAFQLDLLVSANAALSGLLFPSAQRSEVGFTAGLFGALQFAAVRYSETGALSSKLAFVLGVLVGYAGGQGVGNALILGVQPGLSLRFGN